MHIILSKIKIYVLLSFLIIPFIASFGFSQGFSYDFSGDIINKLSYRNLKSDYLLNPEESIFDLSHWTNRLYANIYLNLKYKDINLITKSRPQAYSYDYGTDTKNIIDNAYIDLNYYNKIKFYVGKKNIFNGICYGANPTDFFGEGKDTDIIKKFDASEEIICITSDCCSFVLEEDNITKRIDEKQLEREGDFLTGVDIYYKDIIFTAIYAPELNDIQEKNNRTLLKAYYKIVPINTDLSLNYFNGNIPGIGSNISKTVNDNLILYTETSLRWGSDIKIVKLVKEGTPNIFDIYDPDDSKKVYPNIAAGGSYKFKHNVSIICEYIYKSDRYSNEEWNALINFIKYSYANFKNNLFQDMMKSNLLQANQLVKLKEMRKNYIYLRVINQEIYRKTTGESVLFLNADDNSFFLSPSVEYKINEKTIIGFSTLFFSGNKDTEFGMTHWENELRMQYKYLF